MPLSQLPSCLHINPLFSINMVQLKIVWLRTKPTLFWDRGEGKKHTKTYRERMILSSRSLPIQDSKIPRNDKVGITKPAVKPHSQLSSSNNKVSLLVFYLKSNLCHKPAKIIAVVSPPVCVLNKQC